MVSACDMAPAVKMILTAFIVGFGGISVHMQVMGIVSPHGLSLKPYFLGKLLHGGISAFYMYLAVRFVSIPAFGQNPAGLHWNGKFLFFAFAALVLVWTAAVLWDYRKYKRVRI